MARSDISSLLPVYVRCALRAAVESAPGGEETPAAQWTRTATNRRLYEGLLVSQQGGTLIMEPQYKRKRAISIIDIDY